MSGAAHPRAGMPGLTPWLCLRKLHALDQFLNLSVLHSLLLLKEDSRATDFLWSNWNTVRTMPGIVNKHIVNLAGYYVPCVTQFVHLAKFPECWACQLGLHGIIYGRCVTFWLHTELVLWGWATAQVGELVVITYLKIAKYWQTGHWSWICFEAHSPKARCFEKASSSP